MTSRLWVPVVVAVMLRLLVVAIAGPDQQRVFNTDSYEFDALARNLMDHGEFSRSV